MEKNSKKMEAVHCNTLRGLAETVNSRGIQKEDIVQVIPSNDGFVLLYYK
jgi:hypothetical protein